MEHQDTYYYNFFFHKVFCFPPNIDICVLSINLSALKQEAHFAKYLQTQATQIYQAIGYYTLFQIFLM